MWLDKRWPASCNLGGAELPLLRFGALKRALGSIVPNRSRLQVYHEVMYNWRVQNKIFTFPMSLRFERLL